MRPETIHPEAWEQMTKRKKLWILFSLYLDDILMLLAGICFVIASSIFGAHAAFAVAGACLLAYSIVIARARSRERRGGGRG